jgi:23S rRNA (cytosine1962-C5)-methyltransferase
MQPPTEAVSPWVQLRTTNRHPFVYKKMIRQADPTAQPGAVVNVYGREGQWLARGLYNPRSQIVVRILTREDLPVDDAFWRTRFEQAVALRRQMVLDDATDAYRLVHAEGDGLSGLIAERYADCLVFEVFSLGMYQRCQQFLPILADVLGPPSCLDRPDRAAPNWRLRLRADSRIERIEGFRVPENHAEQPDAPPDRLVIREHGVRYWVDLKAGHKTGFFCDQRDNRARLAAYCRDATVLDLCTYTGGFALCAKLLGDAREVTGVDLDEAAVALAKENANLNQTRIDFVWADAFTFIRQMLKNERQFDVVVLDPPKLAVYRNEYDEALRKYNDFNALAMQVVRPGGVYVTCSCSGLVSQAVFRQTVHQAAQRAGRHLQLIDQTGAAPDHPVMLDCPESEYLKVLWFRVL